MGNFGKSSVHSFSLVEVLVFILAIILVVFVAWPNVTKFARKVKMDNAVDSVYSYKDSVSKYYVSRLMYDTSFSLNGRYTISEGKLVYNDSVYNLHLTGNVPSDGYLDYENNVLKKGCILVDGYYVVVDDGTVTSITDENCMISLDEESVDVALGEV